MKARRRRGLILLLLALASGGLAATQVRERERDVEAQVGPLVSVVVAARDLESEQPLGRRDLAVKRVPARFVPPDALGSPGRLLTARTAVPLAAGSYLTLGAIQGAGAREGGALRPGERALEIAVTGGAALTGASAGSRVDVLVSVERQEGSGRTFVAMEGVEVLELRPLSTSSLASADDPAGAPAATALATLRVTLRQAVYLAAAENFSRELRLLLRPAGDDRRTGAFSVEEEEL
jgi:pilus assembly protein CpaB